MDASLRQTRSHIDRIGDWVISVVVFGLYGGAAISAVDGYIKPYVGVLLPEITLLYWVIKVFQDIRGEEKRGNPKYPYKLLSRLMTVMFMLIYFVMLYLSKGMSKWWIFSGILSLWVVASLLHWRAFGSERGGVYFHLMGQALILFCEASLYVGGFGALEGWPEMVCISVVMLALPTGRLGVVALRGVNMKRGTALLIFLAALIFAVQLCLGGKLLGFWVVMLSASIFGAGLMFPKLGGWCFILIGMAFLVFGLRGNFGDSNLIVMLYCSVGVVFVATGFSLFGGFPAGVRSGLVDGVIAILLGMAISPQAVSFYEAGMMLNSVAFIMVGLSFCLIGVGLLFKVGFPCTILH